MWIIPPSVRASWAGSSGMRATPWELSPSRTGKKRRTSSGWAGPRLFFGITSGNVDSMVNNLTPNLKRRSRDVYSPGGRLLRPDRATIVYADRVHSLSPKVPIVLGGIEASLRRFAHYDYWSDSVRQSILADAPADLLVYGMGERPILEVARRLNAGEEIAQIRDVPGTVVKEEVRRWRESRGRMRFSSPALPRSRRTKGSMPEAFAAHYNEQDPHRGRAVVQPHPKTVIIQNPPALPLSTAELDHIYELPYSRKAHPSYQEAIPALEPVRFSITSHRGCFGSCSFCALTHHQGRIVQSRSISSIVREAKRMVRMPGFKGIIQDVGGPTANMYGTLLPPLEAGGLSGPALLCRMPHPGQGPLPPGRAIAPGSGHSRRQEGFCRLGHQA